jgi:hypothetical protein
MTRAQLLTRLQNKFSAITANIGMATTDTAEGYGPVLDDTLRAMGFTEAQLASPVIADEDIRTVLILAEYYALEQFAIHLTVRFSVGLDGGALVVQLQQVFQQVKAMLDAARVKAQRTGRLSSGAGYGDLLLDFLEPDA